MTEFFQMQQSYFRLSYANRVGEFGKEVRNKVLEPSIVTLTYCNNPYVHILPLEMGIRSVGAKPIDLTKEPKEIADLLTEQGFEKVNISRTRELEDIKIECLEMGQRLYASYKNAPFGIIFPIIYDFSLKKKE